MGFATALAIAGTATSVIGTLGAGRAQAQQQAAMSRYNARLAALNAEATRAKARFDQIRQQRRGRKIMGRLRARLGASGALMSEGAPLALLAEQSAELALENALIGYEGLVTAQKWRSQAAMDIAQAGLYEARGRAEQRASYLKAGSTLLTGFGQAYESGMFGLGQPSFPGSGVITSEIGQPIYRMH